MTSPYSFGETITDGAVGRAVFQSREWNKIQKRIPHISPNIFENKKSPLEISVFLLNFTPDEELTKIADHMAKQREGNRKFYGWVELPVVGASEKGRKVHATPQPQNRWHADIMLPSSARADEKEQERHINELRKIAVPRPPRR